MFVVHANPEVPELIKSREAANQTRKDESPLTLDRSKNIDEEISTQVIDFLERNDPEKTDKPFFVWHNLARMHVTTVLNEKYLGMVGEPCGKDRCANKAGTKEMDDNIGYVLKKLKVIREIDKTIIAFSTDNAADTIMLPNGGVTLFKGGKLTTWKGGMRAPMVFLWPDKINPGTMLNETFASLDWLPTLVEAANGPKCNDLKAELEKGAYPGFIKTTLDGVNQMAYLIGEPDSSARDC